MQENEWIDDKEKKVSCAEKIKYCITFIKEVGASLHALGMICTQRLSKNTGWEEYREMATLSGEW